MSSEWLLSTSWRYSLQIAAVVAVTAACLAALRVQTPRLRLQLLRAALLLCLVALPLAAWALDALGAAAPLEAIITTSPPVVAVSAGVTARLSRPAGSWPQLVLVVYLAGVVFRLAWLLVGLHRLRRRASARVPERVEAEVAVLQGLLGTRAEIEWRPDVTHPATVGLFPPRVLLPASLVDEPRARQRAIVCHELQHVRRADWAHVVIEEAIRIVFWPHPAMHWLIAELRLAREQVIDHEVVTLLGERRPYLEVLYSFAQAPAAWAQRPVAPFFGRHQLERRIRSLVGEVSMSRKRIVLTGLMTAALAVSTAGASGYYLPLDLTSSAQSPSSAQTTAGAGPIERAAQPLAAGGAMPKRVHDVAFEFPSEVRGVLTSALVTINLVVDGSGNVPEARVTRYRSDWSPGADASAVAAAVALLGERTVNTVRQWRYEPPATGPVWWSMTVYYSERGRLADNWQANSEVAASALVSPETSTATGSGEQEQASVPSESALRVGGAVGVPEKILHVSPVYPTDAREQGVQGVVILEATVDAAGAVSDVRVLRSIPMLDQAAADAVRQWKYRPTLMNGVAVPVIMTVTVNFAPGNH